MHVFTAVILRAAHDAEHAAAQARAALSAAAPRHGADYWSVGGGRLDARFHAAGLPEFAETGVAPVVHLTDPLPALLVPAAIVDVASRWHWRPLDAQADDPRWLARLDGRLGDRTGSRWYVAADVHM